MLNNYIHEKLHHKVFKIDTNFIEDKWQIDDIFLTFSFPFLCCNIAFLWQLNWTTSRYNQIEASVWHDGATGVLRFMFKGWFFEALSSLWWSNYLTNLLCEVFHVNCCYRLLCLLDVDMQVSRKCNRSSEKLQSLKHLISILIYAVLMFTQSYWQPNSQWY
jgi:hypothetical protein